MTKMKSKVDELANKNIYAYYNAEKAKLYNKISEAVHEMRIRDHCQT